MFLLGGSCVSCVLLSFSSSDSMSGEEATRGRISSVMLDDLRRAQYEKRRRLHAEGRLQQETRFWL